MEVERGTLSPSTSLSTPTVGRGETKGKHRIMVELMLLEQEAKSLEEEMEELEKMEAASTTCQELLQKVERKPDPLLALTTGPAKPSWERWFEGPQDPKGCSRCWML